MLEQRDRAKGCSQGKYGSVAVYAGSCCFFSKQGGGWYQSIRRLVDVQGRTGRQDASYPANLGFPVCLFIHQGVFDLLPQRQHLPLHNFLLYCIAAERGNNVIGPPVLPSYAHTRLFMGVCVGRNDSGGFQMPCVARIMGRGADTF